MLACFSQTAFPGQINRFHQLDFCEIRIVPFSATFWGPKNSWFRLRWNLTSSSDTAGCFYGKMSPRSSVKSSRRACHQTTAGPTSISWDFLNGELGGRLLSKNHFTKPGSRKCWVRVPVFKGVVLTKDHGKKRDRNPTFLVKNWWFRYSTLLQDVFHLLFPSPTYAMAWP